MPVNVTICAAATHPIRSRTRGVIRRLAGLGASTTADFNESLSRKYAKAYPDIRALEELRKVYNLAVELGSLYAAPKLDVPRRMDPVPAPSRLSRSDVKRLLARLADGAGTWEGHRLYALVVILLFTGLQRNKAIALRIKDLDRSGGPVHVPEVIAPFLEGWTIRLPSGCDWLVPGKRMAGPWAVGSHANALYDPRAQLKAAGREAGIGPSVNFDALHRFYLENGAPDEAPPPAMPPGGRHDETEPLAPPHRLTLDEATRLMAHLRARSATWEGHRLYAIVGLALLAGLRRTEVLELQRDQVVNRRSTLVIPNRPPVPLVPEAIEILGGWLERADHGDTPWVFPGTLLMGPWTRAPRRAPPRP